MEKVYAFKTGDGQLFETEQAAKDHEFTLAIRSWWTEALVSLGKQEKGDAPSDWLDIIIADRAKLLPIFKLLNGGNPIVVPKLSEAA